MWHGILINKEFRNEKFIKRFKIFDKKLDGSWEIYGIELSDDQVEQTIKSVQQAMKSVYWYSHLYNDKKLVVIFKDKVFTVTPNSKSWKSIIKHGRKVGIPDEQLDFRPNKFRDEKQYFAK